MPKTLVDLESLRQSAVRAVTEIFETMLDLEPRPIAEIPEMPDGHYVFGLVHLTGPWNGAVLLECQAQQAYLWTCKMMSVPAPDCLNDDVRDAMGELASMLAGNFKSMMPLGTSISMPTVVEGRQFTVRLLRVQDRIKMDFDSSQGPFSLTVSRLSES